MKLAGLTTRPFFIVSSGRSGTAMLHKVLSAEGTVEMHHEYMVHIVQPLAVKRYMGWTVAPEATRILGDDPWRCHPLQRKGALGGIRPTICPG